MARLTKVETLIKLAKSLEWSSTVQGEGTSMGRNNGTHYPACPKCGGIKPGSGAERDFNESAIGHGSKCPLYQSIKNLK